MHACPTISKIKTFPNSPGSIKPRLGRQGADWGIIVAQGWADLRG